jgi:hypothetical protein
MPLAEASPIRTTSTMPGRPLPSSGAGHRDGGEAGKQPAMGRREGGGASNTPLLHPAPAATATRLPGSLSPRQSLAMSCCRWWFGCMHAKSAAWSSSRLCAPTRRHWFARSVRSISARSGCGGGRSLWSRSSVQIVPAPCSSPTTPAEREPGRSSEALSRVASRLRAIPASSSSSPTSPR